jgi:hypothetical protein
MVLSAVRMRSSSSTNSTRGRDDCVVLNSPSAASPLTVESGGDTDDSFVRASVRSLRAALSTPAPRFGSGMASARVPARLAQVVRYRIEQRLTILACVVEAILRGFGERLLHHPIDAGGQQRIQS